MRTLARATVTAVICALALTGCDGGDGPDDETAAAVSLQDDYQRVVDTVLPSVVEIETGDGLGSGIIYDDLGHIVTNAHVVGEATVFEVTPAAGGDVLKATLVGSYPADDLAVIKVDGELTGGKAAFADSSRLKVGQIVLAMGNPLGLSGSVSQGIVSATGRTEVEGDWPKATIPDMIQTTAAINPGNSGGALVDLDGRVVGIPTLAASSPEGGAAPGIGFAISSNMVTKIAGQLIADGKVTDSGRAALGIKARTVVDAQSRPVGVGVVSVTPGGAAAAAGIERGDVITAIDGTPITAVTELNVYLAAETPGDAVTVTLVRAGSTMDVPVTLGEL